MKEFYIEFKWSNGNSITTWVSGRTETEAINKGLRKYNQSDNGLVKDTTVLDERKKED